MRAHLGKIFLIITILMILTPFKTAYAETLQERLNNLIGPKKQYNTMLSPVYLRNNAIEESISPQSGELSLAQTDYVLPGRKGLDLEIKRLYKSGISNVQEMKVQYVNGAWVDYVYSDANTTSFLEERYNLGIGMRFSFPAMEIKTNEDGTSHKFLHTEAGDTYTLMQVKQPDGTIVYLPETQTIKDVVVKETTEFSNGQPDGVSKYMMSGKEGKKTYFAVDGRVLGIVDRYGNTIKFEYTTLTYTIDGVTKTKKLISKITDTVGRVVTLEYKEDYTYTVGGITNNQYSAEESYKYSQNPNNTDSGELNGKFQVIINLPGGKKIIYDKTAVLVSKSKQVMRTRLQRVYDIDGKVKYHFWYEQPDLGFTYNNGTSYSVYNRYENLVQINYCKVNRVKRYTYNTYTKRLSAGSMQYRKVFENKELIKKGFDNSKTNFLDKYICDVKDKTTYKYTNEADGFGTSGYNEYNGDYLKTTYRYYTDITDMVGTVTKYTYDGIHQLINTEEKGTNHREVTTTTHDEMKFPKKKEVISYNLANGQTVKKIENFRYDEYGNLTNYTSPLATRNADGYPVDNEYTTIYSYAYDRYHVPILKTWKQDKNTTCQVIYEVDTKGNIVKEKKVHTDDVNNWIITDYQYDTYGNMTKKIVNSPDNTYATSYEYGIDANGVDQKGAYLTKEYTVVDGVESAKKYAYEFNSGNVKAEIDANGNRTGYEYDILERITKITYADGSTKQYEYKEYINSNMQIVYTDPENAKFMYEYDTLDNFIKYSLFDNGEWKTTYNVEYDFRGNKIKEVDANGHSSRFEYDSEGKLTKKAFYEKDSINKENITLSYTVGYSNDTPLLATLTDEEGYTSKLYYDIGDRLVKLEETPDKVKYYTTTYAYDYTGNMITETDTRNNTTLYTYDDLDRLAKKTDALGGEITYTYNSLDKMLTTEEPDGRVVGYIYDVLGRVKEEKVYKKGENDYVYKRYSYDKAGNVTALKQGSVKLGVDNVEFDTTYTYNNMNRLSDEYSKIDISRAGHIGYRYDKNGNKIESTEYTNQAEDSYIRNAYTYDIEGRLKQEEGVYRESDGKEHGHYIKKYTRDYAGNVTKQEEYNGNGYDTTTYTYDHRNRMLTKTEPYTNDGATKTTSYGYDKKGNILSEIITKQGVACTTLYRYDGMGKVIAKTNPLGNTSRYVYDAEGNLVKEIDARYYDIPENTASGTEYEYDALNRQIKTTVFDGTNRTVVSYKEYDGRGNVVKDVDGEGYNSDSPTSSIGDMYEYDAANKLIKQTSAQTAKDNIRNGTSNFTKKYTYDGIGKVLTETDGYGNATRNTYYLNGLLKEKIYPDIIKDSYDYDLTGKVLLIKKDRAGNTTKTYNSVFGKPYRIEYADGTFEVFEYTPQGEVKQSYDKAGNVKYFDYDPSGNMTVKREYIKSDDRYDYYKLTKATYDETNNMLSSETFENKVPKLVGLTETTVTTGDRVEYAYDKAGRLIKITEPNGKEAINEYDAKGNVITKKQKVTDGQYDIKRYTYDVQSRVVTESTLIETADIDAERLEGAEFDDEYGTMVKSTVSLTYYKNGQIKSKKDANGSETVFEYDLDNKVTKKTDAMGFATSYTYDLNGNLIQEKNAKAISICYEYDNLGRLIRKKTPSTSEGFAVTRYIYDSMGNLKKEIAPNNYVAIKDTPALVSSITGKSYTYDSVNRRVSTTTPDGYTVEYIKYDANGNVKKTVDGLRYNVSIDASSGTTYTYDGLGRATQVTDALGNSTYFELNVLGNVTRQTDARGNSTLYDYNPDGTLAKTTFADGGVVEYTYDKLGRKLSQKNQNGNVTTYNYNGFGKLKEEKDAYGNTIEYKFDLDGNIVTAKDKRGSVSDFSYDKNNRLVEKKTPLELDSSGNVVYSVESYIYDELGNVTKKSLTSTKDSTQVKELNYTYYDNNLVSTVSDSSGGYTKNYYDLNGNVIKLEKLRTSEVYDIERFEYDNQNRLVKSIKLVDEEDIYNANIQDLMDAEYSGKIKSITGYEYDILGNKVKEISPLAYTQGGTAEYSVRFTYDALNRLEKVIRQHNGSYVYTQYYYDAVGNKIKERNEKGFERQYTYDSVNRLKSSTDFLGKIFTYTYDLAGNKTVDTNAKGYTITYTYDKLNRVDTVTDSYGVVISKKLYDANSNVVKEIDAKGYLSASSDDARYGKLYTYDLANRLVKVVDPEVAVLNKYTEKYEYDQFSQKVKETDALGNSTLYSYDNAGRLVKVTDANGVSTSYAYDKLGNKLYMKDGRGKITSYTYGASRLRRIVTDAENKSISYKYDLSGNMVSVLDRNGNTTLYTYDNRRLLLEKKVTETGDRVNYAYDEVGNRLSMTDESGISPYTYDANNKLLEIRKDGATQISYNYDEIGNISTVTDKKGFVTTYTYDKSSRMETAIYAGKTATYVYDKNGNRQSITYSGGVKEEYTYDKNNRLLTLTNKKPDGSTISNYSYTYDLAGRQTIKTDSYGKTKYTYDKVGRILKVEAPGKTSVYAYDGASNRTSLNETYTSLQPSGFIDELSGKDVQYILRKSEYVYSSTNRLLKLVEKMFDASGKELLQKVTKYLYDDNGNELRQIVNYISPANIKLRQVTRGSVYSNTAGSIDSLIEKTSNIFDGFNRLKRVETVKAGVRTIVEFTYNGDDLRVKKAVAKSSNSYVPEITNYLYDRQHVVLETDEYDKVKVRYVRGINYIGRMDVAGKLSYFMYNGHGDVVQTVSEAGVVENQYDYDIWGNPTLTIEAYTCAIRYAGEFYDAETGLYYLRARYYNPYVGRFISEDSYWGEDVNPLSLNLYTYCSNDPIRYTDPTGHAATVLKNGSKGDGVKALQEMLNKAGYNCGSADGVFGKNTQAAVLKFQKDTGLSVDGVVGNQTLTVLKTASAVSGMSSNMSTVKQAAIESAKKTATVGGIKDSEFLMSSQTFNSALNNISTISKATGGGSVQTSVVGNQLVITGATVPTNSGSSIRISTGTPIAAATVTPAMTSFTSSASVVREAAQVKKDTSNVPDKSTQGTSNLPPWGYNGAPPSGWRPSTTSEGAGNASISTTDHKTGEWVSGVQGAGQTYDVWYKTEKYNLLTPAQKNATYANGKPSNYWVKNNPANDPLFNPANVASVEATGSTALKAAKGAFTKANVAVAVVGIGFDTYDDVSQLQAAGADSATIKAAVVTDVGFGAVGAGISLGAGAATGALVGSAFCPVVGTIVGAGVGIGISLLYDWGTSDIKQSARDSLANTIR